MGGKNVEVREIYSCKKTAIIIIIFNNTCEPLCTIFWYKYNMHEKRGKNLYEWNAFNIITNIYDNRTHAQENKHLILNSII